MTHPMRRHIELCEALARTFTPLWARGREAEIYRNPTRNEWLKALKGADEVRAYLVGGDMYVWNTHAALHQNVRDELKMPADAVPLVVYGRPGRECHCVVTDNSKRGPWHHSPEVARVVRRHPYIQRNFTECTVGYYDEDIVGDWEAEAA